MSFTGAGPLGAFGWGTSCRQALANQEKDVSNKFNAVQHAITHNDNEFPPQPFPTLASATKPGIDPLLFLS